MRPVDVVMGAYTTAAQRGDLDAIRQVPRLALALGLVAKVSSEGALVMDREGTVSAGQIRRTGGGGTYITLTSERIPIESINFENALESAVLSPRRVSSGRGPVRAQKLLSLLLSPDRLEERLGDCDEGYALMSERFGKPYADRWYWWQVLKVAALGLFEIVMEVLLKLWGGPPGPA